MGEIFRWLFDKAADIIRAVQNPWGLAALIVLVLGIVGAYLFRNAAEKLRLAAFAMIIAGLLGLFIFARSSGDSNSNNRIPEAEAETCAQYAASAVADYKLMMENPKCQDYTLFFPFRWLSNYQKYLSWCNYVTSSMASWERGKRDDHLKQCGARSG